MILQDKIWNSPYDKVNSISHLLMNSIHERINKSVIRNIRFNDSDLVWVAVSLSIRHRIGRKLSSYDFTR